AVLTRKAVALRGQERVASLTLMFVVAGALGAATLNRLEEAGAVPIGTYTTFMLPAALLAFAAYVKHAEEPASFQSKLIGVSSVALLVPLGLLGNIVIGARE